MTSSENPPSRSPDFERSLAELEELVERLEQGDLPLDEALSTFERGVALTRECQGALQTAQQRVEVLMKRSGAAEPAPEPFAIGLPEDEFDELPLEDRDADDE